MITIHHQTTMSKIEQKQFQIEGLVFLGAAFRAAESILGRELATSEYKTMFRHLKEEGEIDSAIEALIKKYLRNVQVAKPRPESSTKKNGT